MLQGLFSRHTRLVGAVISALGIAVCPVLRPGRHCITTDACDNAALSQPFAQWNDTNEYKLVRVAPSRTERRGGLSATVPAS